MTEKTVETIDLTGEQSTSLEIALIEALGDNVEVAETEVEDDPDTEGIQEDEVVTEERVKRESLFFFELENKTHTGAFRPKDTDKGFPIRASGQINSIFVLAQSDTFSAYLEIDDQVVLDGKSWSYMNSNSQELTNIGAYQRAGGDYVLVINDYPFNNELDFSLRATSQTTFTTIRVEAIIDEYSRGMH